MRVPRSTLASRSPYMKALFSLPVADGDADGTTDTCPIVLHKGSVADYERFFSFISHISGPSMAVQNPASGLLFIFFPRV